MQQEIAIRLQQQHLNQQRQQEKLSTKNETLNELILYKSIFVRIQDYVFLVLTR